MRKPELRARKLWTAERHSAKKPRERRLNNVGESMAKIKKETVLNET